MTTYLLPLGATALAAIITYLACMRPMLRNRGCAMSAAAQTAAATSSDTDTDDEIRRLKSEVALLRLEMEHKH